MILIERALKFARVSIHVVLGLHRFPFPISHALLGASHHSPSHVSLSLHVYTSFSIPRSSVTTPPCHLVPSSRIRLLATAVAAPLHPAQSLAYHLMVLMVAPLEYPMSVSSHLCRGLPLLLAPFILPSITSSSIPPALTTCPK